MRRVFAIARLNLLELVRDRGELVGAIVLPLLLTWVFSTAFGSAGVERPVVVPIADLDGTVYSRQVAEQVGSSEGLDVDAAEEAEVRELVGAGDVPVGVIIDRGFGDAVASGEPARIRVIRYPGSTNAQAVVTIVEGAARRIDADAAAARATGDILGDRSPGFDALYATADGFWSPDAPVEVKRVVAVASDEQRTRGDVTANVQYSIGFTVFFVFMVAMGSAGGVLEDRELGTLRRLLSAPLRRSEVLGGKILGVATVATLQAGMLITLGAVAFGVPWGDDPIAVVAMLSGLVFSATGLGVMLSALVRTRGQLSALVPIVSTALAMIGGCYWDLEVTSPFMQQLARFTPTGWAVIGFKDVVARGAGVGGVILPLAVLWGFAIVTLAVGTLRLKLE